jgi:murein DD-endopeptidase MepM/ murein hydrolase activator NlpD
MRSGLVIMICAFVLLTGCAARQRAYVCPRPVYYVATSERSYQPPAGGAVTQTASPATAANVQYHTVKPGETMWGISRMYGVDLDALAKANSIVDNRSIEKGQVLIVPLMPFSEKTRQAPAAYSSAKKISFCWPVKGSVISRFGDKTDAGVNKGIDISASEGMRVVASMDGKVVYCDSHLKGFGQTVIIDHTDGYQTVYSYNSEILVKAGDTVRQGEVIAKVGQSGRAKAPMLHFEIRHDGEPQNPARYLAN